MWQNCLVLIYKCKYKVVENYRILVLALRRVDGSFTTNPDPDIIIEPHQVLIAVGNDDDFHRLEGISK